MDTSEGRLTVDLVRRSGLRRRCEDRRQHPAGPLDPRSECRSRDPAGSQRPADRRREAKQWIVKAADSLLDKAHLESGGESCIFKRNRLSPCRGIKILEPAVTASQMSRSQDEREQSQADRACICQLPIREECFPAPTLYGGRAARCLIVACRDPAVSRTAGLV